MLVASHSSDFFFLGALPSVSIKKINVLVISPLISIISDQVTSFNLRGITAAFTGDKDRSVIKGIKKGAYQLIFISPKSLFCSFEWRRVLCTDVFRSNLASSPSLSIKFFGGIKCSNVKCLISCLISRIIISWRVVLPY